MTKSEGMTKHEKDFQQMQTSRIFRHPDFAIVSSFGFRISDFSS